MSRWKPPLTKAGAPCKRCVRGRPCPSHRKGSNKLENIEGKRGRYKLDRPLLKQLPDIVRRTRCYTEIWEGLGISHQTFYNWMHQGEADAEERRATLEREFWQTVRMQRRVLAQRLLGRAVEAAEGVVVEEETPDGPRTFKQPPDGRLAAQLAGRLDRDALPPERQEVEPVGSVAVVLWRPGEKGGDGK